MVVEAKTEAVITQLRKVWIARISPFLARTASIQVNLQKVKKDCLAPGADALLTVPVTQAVVYGWYDNELGSYTNMLGDLTVQVAEKMI